MKLVTTVFHVLLGDGVSWDIRILVSILQEEKFYWVLLILISWEFTETRVFCGLWFGAI